MTNTMKNPKKVLRIKCNISFPNTCQPLLALRRYYGCDTFGDEQGLLNRNTSAYATLHLKRDNLPDVLAQVKRCGYEAEEITPANTTPSVGKIWNSQCIYCGKLHQHQIRNLEMDDRVRQAECGTESRLYWLKLPE